MNCNNVNEKNLIKGYDCGVLSVPSHSFAKLKFTSDAAYENIILITKFSNGCVIHKASNKIINGLSVFTIKNYSSTPKYYLITSFHRVSSDSNYIQNAIQSKYINEMNYSYNFEDGVDYDYNDITVTITLQKFH